MTECLSLQNNVPELVPVSKISEVLPYVSTGAVRQYIFNNTNGFKDRVVRYMGHRQFLKMSEFFAWVDDSNKKAV